MIERFKVWEERPADPQADPLKLPELHPVGATWLGIPGIAARTMYSLGFILAAALGFGFLNVQPADSRGFDATPVQRARGGDILWIDGNLDGFGVAFKHAEHEKREGDKAVMREVPSHDLPRDEGSACARCHRDMYLPSTPSGMTGTRRPPERAIACYQCHAEAARRGRPQPPSAATNATKTWSRPGP